MKPILKDTEKLAPLSRILLEVGFILFLFYSNLLMGEFTNSGVGQNHSLIWAVEDIFTKTNFILGLALALVGYLVIELLRKRL